MSRSYNFEFNSARRTGKRILASTQPQAGVVVVDFANKKVISQPTESLGTLNEQLITQTSPAVDNVSVAPTFDAAAIAPTGIDLGTEQSTATFVAETPIPEHQPAVMQATFESVPTVEQPTVFPETPVVQDTVALKNNPEEVNGVSISNSAEIINDSTQSELDAKKDTIASDALVNIEDIFAAQLNTFTTAIGAVKTEVFKTLSAKEQQIEEKARALEQERAAVQAEKAEVARIKAENDAQLAQERQALDADRKSQLELFADTRSKLDAANQALQVQQMSNQNINPAAINTNPGVVQFPQQPAENLNVQSGVDSLGPSLVLNNEQMKPAA